MRARNIRASWGIRPASFLAIALLSFLTLSQHTTVAQDASFDGQDTPGEFAWVEELTHSAPLEPAIMERYRELAAKLDADTYRERENATCELLLLPRRVSVELFKLRDAPSAELRHRVAFLLSSFSEDAQPFSAYIARQSAIPTKYLSAQFSNYGVDEILNRIDLETMTDHPGVWSLLFRYSATQEERQRVLTMLARISDNDPTVILYRGLLNYHASSPQARSNLIDFIPDSAGIELVLAVAQASANDPNPVVQSARNRLLRRLRSSLNIDDMLTQYSETQDLQRKVLLLELLVLTHATQEQRMAWLKLGEEASDPTLRTSFMQMAAREGMHEVLESTLLASDPAARFSLLSAVGHEEHWAQELASQSPQSYQAVTWLPFSTLSVDLQITHLLRIAETSTESKMRSIAGAMLSGYGCHRVLTKALEWLETRQDLADIAIELLAQHAWLLPSVVADPLSTEWYKSAPPYVQATILIWYETQASTQALHTLALSADIDTARIALDALAARQASWLGCQIAATRNVHKVDHVPASLIASFDKPADILFEELLEHGKENPGLDIGVQRDSEQARMALSLVLYKHEGFRRALTTRNYQARNRQTLLALYNDETGVEAEQSALDDRPQDLLYFAKVLLLQGREELLVQAIVNTLKFGPLPNDLDPIPLTRTLASDAGVRRVRTIFDGISKMSAQEQHLSLLTLPLSVNRITRPYLDILASAGMVKGTESYRRMLLIGAASSPDLNHDWLSVRREIWETASKESVEQALSFLEVVVDKNIHSLLSFGTNSPLKENKSQLDMRIPALVAAARFGSRNALIAAGNAIYGVGRNDATLAPRGNASAIDAAFRLDLLCQDAPTLSSTLKAQMVWRSTRFAWSFDGQAQRYVLEKP